MLDVILLAEGEIVQSFDLAIGLDRDQPAQTALGLTTPVPVVATTNGPPHVGATGWLFHIDAPHLLLHSFRPAADGAHALLARFQECTGYGTQVGLRCARDPQRALMTDVRGNTLMEAGVSGDTVSFEIPPNDLATLRIEFP
jgi:hypothetical protein